MAVETCPGTQTAGQEMQEVGFKAAAAAVDLSRLTLARIGRLVEI